MSPESQRASNLIEAYLEAYQLMMESKQEHDPDTPCLFCDQPSGENAIVFDRDLGGLFCSSECRENREVEIAFDFYTY